MAFCEAANAALYARFDEADAHVTRLFQLGGGFSPSWVQLIGGGVMVASLQSQGRLAELRQWVDDRLAEMPDFPTYMALSAGIAAAENDAGRAATDVARLVVDGEVLLPWADLPALLLRTCAASAVRITGDVSAARALYDELIPYQDRIVWSGVASHGPMHRYLAGLAEVLGDEPEAERHHQKADHLLATFDLARSDPAHPAAYRSSK